jgi:outer membrane protein assembly factor BamB
MKRSPRPRRTANFFEVVQQLQERSGPIASCVFLFLACLLLAGIASAAPSVTLSKKSGPPTSKILVSGRGFESNVGVDIFFDTKDKALVVTNGKGEFHDAGIHAPHNAHPGEHWVTALERHNDKGAQAPFMVFTDWPQYHFDSGRTGFNPYENVLDKDTVSGLGLRWEAEDLKMPAVSNGLVYAGSLEGNGFLFALNDETGETVWVDQFDSTTESGPAVSGKDVYDGSIAAAGASFSAMDALTGSMLWSSTCGQIYDSPALSNGLVYIAGDNQIFAFDAGTGSTIWSRAFSASVSTTTPAVAEGEAFEIPADEVLYALDAKSGAVLWTFTSGDQSGVYSNPAVSNGVVFVSFGKVFYAVNASNGSVVWTYPVATTDPAIANGIVYFGSGKFVYALNAVTGVLLWRYTASGQITSPSVANGVVYFGSLSNIIYALDAKNGQLLWSSVTDCCQGFGFAPAIVNGWLYAGGLQAFSLQGAARKLSNSILAPKLTTLHPNLALRPSNRRLSSAGGSVD